MSNYAISVSQLSKSYRLGCRPARYATIRGALTGALSGALRRNRLVADAAATDDLHWALRDVDLAIAQGETVGVIGRNGAGKSTLLKILSRITPPTSGYADVYGRVGSLLEVGTGFHLELTGRENIYLSGAILGMRKNEMDRSFDEIVSFAGVEKHVDTAVKHYSTGMYLRLAFAVAAHLRSEILLVDEVLSVGDAAFQKRCIGKMGDVAREGRTVLFVSHNMAAVRSLCTSGIVLDGGRVALVGGITECTNAYFRLVGVTREAGTPVDGSNDESGVFGRLSVSTEQFATGAVLQSKAMKLATTLRLPPHATGFTLFCLLEDLEGRTVFHLRRESHELLGSVRELTRYAVSVEVPPLWLSPGLYSAHFKVLFWGPLAKSRHLSDHFPVDIAGDSSNVPSILHPQDRWQCEAAGRAEGVA